MVGREGARNSGRQTGTLLDGKRDRGIPSGNLYWLFLHLRVGGE